MKHIKLTVAALSIILLVTSCKKDPNLVTTTDPVGAPIIVAPVAPPTASTDSSIILGNPSGASDDALDTSNFLMRELYYAVSYNRDLGRPNWVSWHVVPSDYGAVSRLEDFRENPNLPSGWYQVTATSFAPYTTYGFDKGHMCPSADRTSSPEANSSTFLMTNIIAQAPNNNQLTWARLENYCRDSLVKRYGNELYIIAGTLDEGGIGKYGPYSTLDNGRVSVPAFVWKVIVVIPSGSGPNDISNVKNTTRVISVMMPNDQNIGTNWRQYRTSVDAIEQQTGYDIISKVSPSVQNVIEARIDNL